MALVKLNNLYFYYKKDAPLISNLSFELEYGQALGIIGPNGGGKSTLLNLIMGFLTPISGEIKINSKILKDIDFSKISYLRQHYNHEHNFPITIKEFINLNAKKSSKMNYNEILELIKINKNDNCLIRELSGGERKRVELGHILMSGPELILLDEPSGDLDKEGVEQLQLIIKDILKKYNMGIIMVDHQVEHVLKYCDKILCINKSYHWHDKKELLKRDILNSIYHCEFEHTILHENSTKCHNKEKDEK